MPDVALRGALPTVYFGPPQHLTVGGVPIDLGSHAAPHLVDWNHDGVLDLLVASGDGYVWLFPQNRPTNGPDFGTGIRLTAAGSTIRVGSGYTGACFADIDGDGLPDLIVAGDDNLVSFFHNVGSLSAPQFDSGTTINGPNGAFLLPTDVGGRIEIADWDGDGLLDLFTGGFNGYLTWYRNTGTRQSPIFGVPGIQMAEGGVTIQEAYNLHPRVVDFNRDGVLDIVYGVNWGYAKVLINTLGPGAMNFPSVIELSDTNGVALNIRSLNGDDMIPDFGDLDGDGVVDLVSGGRNGQLFFLAGVASGQPPTVTQQPQGIVLNQGDTFVLRTKASGSAPLSYLWLSGEVAIPPGSRVSGQMTDTLTIRNSQLSDAGQYRIKVSNLEGSVLSDMAQVTVVPLPPAITQQPLSAAVAIGTTNLLSVTASGTPPLLYQWRQDGLQLAGQTNSTLRQLITLQTLGGYDVVVSNPYGKVTSAVANISKWPAPIAVKAVSYGSPQRVIISFSSQLDPVVVTDLTHYSLLGAVNLIRAEPHFRHSDMVVLAFSGADGVKPTNVVIRGLQSASGGEISPEVNLQVSIDPEIPTDAGTRVAGFQDDFTSPILNPLWVARGFTGVAGSNYFKSFVATNGMLRILANSSDPIHLDYEAQGYNLTNQEVLIRMRVENHVPGFGTFRGGPAVGIGMQKNIGWIGLGLHTRDDLSPYLNSTGRDALFLADYQAWSSSYPVRWNDQQWYWMRLRYTPDSRFGQVDLRAKFWAADGATPEPQTWLEWDVWPKVVNKPGDSFDGIPTILSSGFAGLAGHNSNGSVEEVDYFLVKAEGLPAISVSPPPTRGGPNPPDIELVTNSFEVALGGSLTISPKVFGESSTVFRWSKDGLELQRSNSPKLTVRGFTTNQSSGYLFEAENIWGRATSAPVSVTVITPPSIGNPLGPVTVLTGQSIGLDAGAVGTNLVFQWWKDQTKIPDATNVLLELNTVSTVDSALYSVVVKNIAGTVTNGPVRVAVISEADIGYEIVNGGVMLTSAPCVVGKFIVPELIGGIPVTSIGQAFRNCTNLSEVQLPAGLEDFAPGALLGCSSLRQVTIPHGIHSLQPGIFSSCTSLTNVVLPEGLKTIAYSVFANCTALTRITIPGNVTYIAFYAFAGCSNLSKVYFEGNAPSIGDGIFQDSDNVSVYHLPQRLGWGDSFGGRPVLVWDDIPVMPDLAMLGLLAPNVAKFGQSFTVQIFVTNQGAITANTWTDALYLQNQDDFDAPKILLQTIPSPVFLPLDGSYTRSVSLVVPFDTTSVPGNYLLTAVADINNEVFETNKTNNTSDVVMSFTLPPFPDLAVASLDFPAVAAAGQPVTVTWSVTNLGTASAIVPWREELMLAANADGSDILRLGAVDVTNVLSPGLVSMRTLRVILPAHLSGTYWPVVSIDSDNQVPEYVFETNNYFVSPTPVQLTAPDLAATFITTPATSVFGNQVNVSWVVNNTGSGDTVGPWTDGIYLSTTGATLEGAVRLASVGAPTGLSPGKSYTNSATITLPFNASSLAGTAYLLVAADADNSQAETTKRNNLAAAALAVQLPPLPDLVVGAISTFDKASPGQTIPVMWGVTNLGTALAGGVWTEALYAVPSGASPNDVLDASGRPKAGLQSLGTFTYTNAISPGDRVARTEFVTLPLSGLPNEIRLAVVVDARNDLIEAVETNNVALATNVLSVPTTLTLQLSATTVREDSAVPIHATLYRNGDTSRSLLVAVSVYNTNALVAVLPGVAPLPPGGGLYTVTIPANQATVSFDLQPVDDHVVDPDQSVAVIVAAPRYESSSATVTVVNVDQPNLALSAPTNSLYEGNAISLTLTRDVVTSNAVSVILTSSSPGHLSPPSFVTIPAGMASTAFSVLAVDDAVAGPTANYSLSADAVGFNSASIGLTVLDSDVPQLTVSLSRHTVSEGDGPQATVMTVTRSPVGVGAINIEPATSNDSLIDLPLQITIPPGQASRSFPVGVIDDSLVNGTRTGTVGAFVLAGSTANRLAQSTLDTITVLDDDGPTLKVVAAQKLVSEGLDPATTLTITRNTAVTNALLVTLVSGNTNTATLPATVTIPLGQASASVNVASIADHTNSGNRTVTFTASAPDYTPGVETITVSDTDLPDLVVGNLAFPSSALPQQSIPISYRISNQGRSAAAGNFLTRIYLSDDAVVGNDLLVAQFRGGDGLAVGSAFDDTEQIMLPLAVGYYWVVVETDAEMSIPETLEDNNTLVSSTPIFVSADYGAWVQTDLTNAPAGTPVALYGRATNSVGAGVAGKPVNVHILLRGTERILTTTTDTGGAFNTAFIPLPGEAGRYDIFATHPALATAPVQDSFELLGFRANPSSVGLTIVEGATASGSVSLENLSDVPLEGATVQVVSAPTHLNVSATLAADQIASQTQLNYQFTATAADAYGTVQLRVSTVLGLTADIYFGVSVEPLRPRLVVAPVSLYSAMVVGNQTVVNFDVSNQGGRESGPITLSLPAVPWMRLASANPMPSLAPGQTNHVTLVLTPDSTLQIGPYTGSLALNADNAGTTVPFSFRAMSEAIGGLRIDVVDEFTYFAAGAPHLAGAAVTLRDSVTQAVVTNGVTDTNGLFYVTQLNEAYYDIDVSADKHTSFHATQLLKGGLTNEVQAFLSRQTVTYTWTVDPVQIEDKYKVSINTTFEASVPVPVVTLSPSSIDLNSLVFANGRATKNITLENHGSIAVQNVEIRLPDHPLFKFTTPSPQIGILGAQSSLTIPVSILSRENEWDAATNIYAAFAAASMEAPVGNTNWQSIPIFLPIDEFLNSSSAHNSSTGIKLKDLPPDLPNWLIPKQSGCDNPGDAWTLWGRYYKLDLYAYKIYALGVMQNGYSRVFGNQASQLFVNYINCAVGKTEFDDTDEIVKGFGLVNGFGNCRVTKNVTRAIVSVATQRIRSKFTCDTLPPRVQLQDLFSAEELKQFGDLLEFVPYELDIPAFVAGGGASLSWRWLRQAALL